MKKMVTGKVVCFILVITLLLTLLVPVVYADSDYEVKYTTMSEWDSAFQGQIEIVNKSNKELDQWKIEFDWDKKISQIWNARLERNEGGHYIIRSEAYNQIIPPGGKLSFGFLGTNGQNISDPTNYSVTDIYDELAKKDLEWQNYLGIMQGTAFQKSWADGMVTATTSFESDEPFRIGYEIIEKNPVEKYIQARYENVEIPTKDGIKLKGIFFPVSCPKGTIIMLHGRGSTALWEVPKLKFLLDNSYQILVYNSRSWNYHTTPEKYIGLMKNDLDDIGCSIDYLKGRYDVDKSKIGIYGFSYGANKALMETALRSDVKVLISDGATQNIPTYSEYFTWERIGQDFLNIYEDKFGQGSASLGIDFFPSIFTNALSSINIPVLFIQGLNDTSVPVEDVEVLYNSANAPKDKIILPQSGHCNGDLTEDKTLYESKILDFLNTYLN